MRIIILTIFLFINIIFQSTYMHLLEIRGVVPNITLIIIVSFALLRGSGEGAIIGFFAGLLQDIFFGRVIGFYALLGMYIGFFSGYFNKDFYRESVVLPFFLVVVSTFFYDGIIYIFTFLIRGRTNFMYYFNNIILPELVYTVAITIFIYRFIYFINEKIEQREKPFKKFFNN